MPNGAGDTTPVTPRLASGLRVGVVALQGAFEAHQERLTAIGVDAPLIRTPSDLESVDAVVLPGGESTTMSRLLATSGLFEVLEGRFADGMPVLGTCAGMILCATDVLDGRPDQRGFGLIDLTVRRNGYGRQLNSFESDIDVVGLDEPFHAVFIRAPLVERLGDDIEILASVDGVAVLVRNQRCTVAAFHPELTNDVRIHEMFVSSLSTSH